MPHPITAPLVAWLSRLRHPTLFKITVVLLLVSWLWPFDPIPFLDEIATALATLVLANWRKPEPPSAGRTIEGEARRE